MKELMQQLVDAMTESATDTLGDGYPEWYWQRETVLAITTQRSRDPSKSRNGGEYFYRMYVEIRPDGAEVWDGSSCELVSEAEEKARSAKLYPISLTKEGLNRMAYLAEARALTMIVPEETLDPTMIAVIEKACALFGSPRSGIGPLKEAVRKYEVSFAAIERWEADTGKEWPH